MTDEERSAAQTNKDNAAMEIKRVGIKLKTLWRLIQLSVLV